jgi:hypothetical protein
LTKTTEDSFGGTKKHGDLYARAPIPFLQSRFITVPMLPHYDRKNENRTAHGEQNLLMTIGL